MTGSCSCFLGIYLLCQFICSVTVRWLAVCRFKPVRAYLLIIRILISSNVTSCTIGSEQIKKLGVIYYCFINNILSSLYFKLYNLGFRIRSSSSLFLYVREGHWQLQHSVARTKLNNELWFLKS